jgi:hypothetical protein
MTNEITEIMPLILAGDGYQLTISPEAEARKAAMLAKSESVTTVTSNDDSAAAQRHTRSLAAMQQALNAFETELCLMRDPVDLEVAWLAVRPYRVGMPPILLHRLPWILWDQPHTPTDQEPF